MKNRIFFLFVLISINIYPQTALYIKDSISKKPAPYIMVLNENNEILTSSNELGKVLIDEGSHLTKRIFLQSIFYEKKEIVLKNLKNKSTIFITPKVNKLDEVVLTNPKGKYLLLTAYYRIYNMTDGVLSTFVDAEVKYIKKGKSFKKKVVNFRIFDKIPKEKYKKVNPYWVPNLHNETFFKNSNSKFYLLKKDNEDFIKIIDKKSKKVLGTIKTKSNLNHNSNIIITANEEKGDYYNIINTEEYKNDILLNTSIKDLKYKYMIIKRRVTPKRIKILPDLKGKKLQTNVKEIFIQSADYITKKEYREIMKKGYKNTTVSHYTSNFWKNLKIFTPLDPALKKQLEEDLVERR